MKQFATLCLALVVTGWGAGSARAAKRVALVMGNDESTYRDGSVSEIKSFRR